MVGLGRINLLLQSKYWTYYANAHTHTHTHAAVRKEDMLLLYNIAYMNYP